MYGKRKEVFLLVIITVIGTCLRMYRLGYQSLWLDEILTFLSSNGTLSHVLFQTEIQTNILPLYYLVVHAFLALSDQEVFLRVPSLIFGSLTIPLFYYTVRHTFGTQMGLWASSLLAISPFHIFYSQEARPYAMFLLLCLLAFYLLQLCIEKKESRLLKLSFAIVGASTFYCHTAAIPFLAFLGLYIVIVLPMDQWRNWIPTFLGLGILLLPALYRAFIIQVYGKIWQTFDPFSLPNILWVFTTGFSFGSSLLDLHVAEKMKYVIPHFLYIVPIFILILGLVLYGARKTFQDNKANILVFALFFFLPISFMSLAAIVTFRPFHVRHVVPSLLPFIVFIALGIHSLQKRVLQNLCVGIFIVISGFSLNNYYFDNRYHREDNRGAANFLTMHSIENDLVICRTPYTTTNLFYYLPPPRLVKIIPFRTKAKVVTSQQLPEEMKQAITGRDRFWVFYSGAFEGKPKGPLEQHFDENYPSRLEFYSSGIKLILYEVVKDNPRRM